MPATLRHADLLRHRTASRAAYLKQIVPAGAAVVARVVAVAAHRGGRELLGLRLRLWTACRSGARP